MGSAAMDTSSEAIRALDAVDPDDLTDEDLDELAIRLHRERHRLEAAIAKVAARWEARGVCHCWRLERSIPYPLARDGDDPPPGRRDAA